MTPRATILIPSFNHAPYVVEAVRSALAQTEPDVEVLVIDDGSTDDTPCLLASQPVDVIRHATNRGYGRSIRDAFRWANCYGYDWLITMDCDEQHEPASLPDFYAAIERNDADIISGTRYGEGSEQKDLPPADRRRINATITQMLNEHLGLNLTDAFCGYKAYRVKALNKLRLTVDGYAIPLQFWVQAAAHDLRITELPIRLIYNDPNRTFGGPLDEAERRLKHYRDVFCEELAKFGDKFASPCGCHGEAASV